MVRFERLSRFAKGDNRDYAPFSPIEFSMRLSEILDKLANIAKGDRRDLVPKGKFELLQLSEILDRLRRLPIIFKRDFVSVSPILNLLRLRQTLIRLANLLGAYLKSANTLLSSISQHH